MTEAVTVLGLGPMGNALAAAFAKAGHPTTTWNRTATRPTPPGTTRAASVAAAVATAPLTVVCLLDYDAVRSVLAPAGDALSGRHLVNLTSGTPDAAREVAGWAADRGITYTDGAITTPTETIGTDAAMILHSGHPVALPALGGTQRYLGADPGRAAGYDVALLDLFWTSVAGVIHAFAMARAENIPATELASFAKDIAMLMPSVIDEHSARLDKGDHDGDYANITAVAAGMHHIIESAAARGIDASVMRAAHALAARAIEAGHGGDGVSRLTLELERASGS
ncbi:NAD(P)-binding domain-containing protein [Actinophytocola glycyrrhizae]|uniref:NAD(P)-binding domain-containing protein n=1 Tax=Actinophytocola glycyrrhizae TaxID=2044873 RepID=A0ABV9S3T4_9PSEU